MCEFSLLLSLALVWVSHFDALWLCVSCIYSALASCCLLSVSRRLFVFPLSNTICKIIYLCRKLFRRLKLIAPDTVVCVHCAISISHAISLESKRREILERQKRVEKNACESHSLRMIKSLRVSCWYINFRTALLNFNHTGRWIIDKLRAGRKITIQMALCWPAHCLTLLIFPKTA